MKKKLVAACSAIALLLTLGVGSAGATTPAFTTIATGLHSPRGLAFGWGDRLFVAEAGLGSGTATGGIANTGSITVIRHPGWATPTMSKFVIGLPSAGSNPGDALGISGLSVLGHTVYGIMGESPAVTGPGWKPAFGSLVRFDQKGHLKKGQPNVGAVDYDFTGDHPELDPGGQFPDANPYGVLAQWGRTYVADAGANTLDVVFPDGKIKILAYFPNTPLSDAVPTCVVKGPDGWLYIGTLALADSFKSGPSAKVYRINPRRFEHSNDEDASFRLRHGDDEDEDDVIFLGPKDEWATGLGPINGCAFGPNGAFYATELFTSVGPQGQPLGGDVVKIPFKDPDDHISLTGGTLVFPGGVAVAKDGTVYAAEFTTSANGAVVRLKED